MLSGMRRPLPIIRWPRTAYVASYPPRECGIATFTRDLVEAVDRLNSSAPGGIVAMNDPGRSYSYPASVKWQIDRDLISSYKQAAEYLNGSRYQVVNVQHEYGLFGGIAGDYLFHLLDELQMPVVLSLHTVLSDPAPELRAVTRELIRRCDYTIVLAKSAIDILMRDYHVDPDRLRFIPHGVPNVQFVDPERAKRALGLQGRPVLATCGLMNPGKGIEYALQAMAGLVDEFPDLVYLVVGETHPGVRAQIGEAYREQLVEQVRRLGLQAHVRFENRYLSYRELVLHLLACDVYVVPYLDLNQIVSGTLAYAVGCGRAIVSTPSVYAREILAEGRGLFAEPRNPRSLQSRLAALLRNPDYRRAIQERAYAYGHEMIWPNVARGYLETFQAACDGRSLALAQPVPDLSEALTA
jgi:glycosyltransferase involved in cell wall biosynthesis